MKSLKEAIAAGDAKVEEARAHFAEAKGQLRYELEEEIKLLKLEQDKNAALAAWQASIGQMIRDADAQALSKCSFSLAYKLSFLPVYAHTGFLSPRRVVSGFPGACVGNCYQAPDSEFGC
jgi:hypothetical protein